MQELRYRVSDQALQQMPDYHMRVHVLQNMGYIDHEKVRIVLIIMIVIVTVIMRSTNKTSTYSVNILQEMGNIDHAKVRIIPLIIRN